MNILLVEDNVGDQMLIQEAFQEADIQCDLHIVKDGMEAIRFLNREEEFQNAARPHFVILDLNLPKKNGREVLNEIKNSKNLQHIPVVIFSNSKAQNDVCDCYALKANVYVGKPYAYEGFLDFAQMIKGFWISQASYCSR